MKTIFKEVYVLIALLIVCFTSTSCFQKFYKAETQSANISVDSLLSVSPPKYFILRAEHDAFKMTEIVMDSSGASLLCKLDRVDKQHFLYLNANPGKPLKYHVSKGEAAVLNEVHVYITRDSNLAYGEKYTIPTGNITKIEVLQKNKSKTTQSTITSAAGIAAGATALTVGAAILGGLLIIAVIAAL